jgi:membrane protease YdiL (CAAX protease family)
MLMQFVLSLTCQRRCLFPGRDVSVSSGVAFLENLVRLAKEDTTAKEVEAGPAEHPRKHILLAEMAIGYALIMVTIWTPNPRQRVLFWISAAWFLVSVIVAKMRRVALGFGRPPLRMTVVTVSLTILLSVGMGAIAAVLGTLHGLFGVRAPLLHASGYLLWAVVQQYIQQSYFFSRIEKFTTHGVLASFITALLFSLAHLPNPVLTPVTFAGGWALSELFRRYRNVYPLAVAHGLIGLAIAVSVPDHIHHHMRVGLGYLRYPR